MDMLNENMIFVQNVMKKNDINDENLILKQEKNIQMMR
jgi:hypothetical protein